MSGLSIHVGRVVDTPQRFQLECDAGWWDRAREHLRELEVVLHRPFRLEHGISGCRCPLVRQRSVLYRNG